MALPPCLPTPWNEAVLITGCLLYCLLQVMQHEADDGVGKAIGRYIYSAFRDAAGEPTSDSNPLLRRNHKLSATNPLL